MTEEKRKRCPLDQDFAYCNPEDCAIWCEDEKMCSIMLMAQGLRHLFKPTIQVVTKHNADSITKT